MKTSSLFTISALAGMGSVAGKKAFVPKRAALQKQLAVRGGGGPIEPATAANIMGGLYLAQGAMMSLAPLKTLESYGYDPEEFKGQSDLAMVRRGGLSTLSLGLIVFALHMQNYSSNTALALMASVWVAEWFHTLANGTQLSVSGDSIGLALSSATVYGCVTDADWAPLATKAFCGFGLFAGFAMTFLSNETVKTIFQCESTGSPLSMRTHGYNTLCLGIMQYLLIFQEMDILDATGKLAVCGLLCFVKALLAKEIPEDQSKPVYVWMTLTSVLAYSILG